MITIKNFLKDIEVRRLNLIIAEEEKKTSGEIKVLIVQSCRKFPGLTLRSRTKNRANREFFELGLDHTRDHTGILLMLSLNEKRIEVRAGKSINNLVQEKTWKIVVREMKHFLKKRRYQPAFAVEFGIRIIGNILSLKFPAKDDDVNEIPNEIIFKE